MSHIIFFAISFINKLVAASRIEIFAPASFADLDLVLKRVIYLLV